jgi:hypothetical protein
VQLFDIAEFSKGRADHVPPDPFCRQLGRDRSPPSLAGPPRHERASVGGIVEIAELFEPGECGVDVVGAVTAASQLEPQLRARVGAGGEYSQAGVEGGVALFSRFRPPAPPPSPLTPASS